MQMIEPSETDTSARDSRHVTARQTWCRVPFAIAALFCAVSAEGSVSIADLLLPNATITSGDKEFFNFRNATQSGSIFVGWDSIYVDPITGGPGSPETESGIRFSSALWTLAGPNLSYDLSVEFNVRTVSGLPLITGNTLEMTGGFIGDGSASVDEVIVDQLTQAPLGTNNVFFNTSAQIAQDTAAFPGGPYEELEIRKDFSASTGATAGSRVFVSHFDQTFQQVPEPGSAAIAALSALVIIGGTSRSRARHASR